MINPAPLHFYFFGGIFSLSFLLLIAATPILMSDWMISGLFLGLFIGVILFSFIACYRWVFVSKRPAKAMMLEFGTLLITLHPFVFGIHHWPPLTEGSELIQTSNWWENRAGSGNSLMRLNSLVLCVTMHSLLAMAIEAI